MTPEQRAAIRTAVNEAYCTAGQVGHLRAAPLSDAVLDAMLAAHLKALEQADLTEEQVQAGINAYVRCDANLAHALVAAYKAIIAARLAREFGPYLKKETAPPSGGQVHDAYNAGYRAGERAGREQAEQAIRECPSLDDNGYICEKAKAIDAIRRLAELM